MRGDGLSRMARAIAALKQAELAALAGNRAVAAAARRRAAVLRAEGLSVPPARPGTSAADLIARDGWQAQTRRRSGDATAAAAAADADAVPLRARLARTMGRAAALEALLAREAAARAAAAARREEAELAALALTAAMRAQRVRPRGPEPSSQSPGPSSGPPSMPPGDSSAGIA